jgi:hypothetical protein
MAQHFLRTALRLLTRVRQVPQRSKSMAAFQTIPRLSALLDQDLAAETYKAQR